MPSESAYRYTKRLSTRQLRFTYALMRTRNVLCQRGLVDVESALPLGDILSISRGLRATVKHAGEHHDDTQRAPVRALPFRLKGGTLATQVLVQQRRNPFSRLRITLGRAGKAR